MVKDKAYMWVVFLMLGLLGLIGCSAMETPVTVETARTPVAVVQDQTAAYPAAKTVELVAPAVLISETESLPLVNATDATSGLVSVRTEAALGANVAQEGVAPDAPAGMANPASVYCEEHGGRVQLRNSDAGQYGVCVFSDGQECEEWALYRGECTIGTSSSAAPAAPSTAPQVAPRSPQMPSGADWIGVIAGTPLGSQFDDYFQMVDQDGARVGIDGQSDEINAQLIAARDSGVMVHVWGTLNSDTMDVNGSQILATRLEVASAATEMEWLGTIVSTPAGAQYDDSFQIPVDWQDVSVGIDGQNDEIDAQLVALRNTGDTVHIWGMLHTGVSDVNGTQIEVTRLEVIPAEAVSEWLGNIISMPAGSQHDDYFQVMDQNRTCAGIDGRSAAIDAQLVALRDAGVPVRIRGVLVPDVPDAYGSQIQVTQIQVAADEMESEWIGTILSMPAGGQYDDYFQMMDQNGTRAGITGRDDAINKRLVELRDTGVTVHIWGVFHKAVPDAYELQIEVSRLETE